MVGEPILVTCGPEASRLREDLTALVVGLEETRDGLANRLGSAHAMCFAPRIERAKLIGREIDDGPHRVIMARHHGLRKSGFPVSRHGSAPLLRGPREGESPCHHCIGQPHSRGTKLREDVGCIGDEAFPLSRDHDTDGSDDVKPVRKAALPGGQVVDDDSRAPSLTGEGDDLRLAGAEIPFDDGRRQRARVGSLDPVGGLDGTTRAVAVGRDRDLAEDSRRNDDSLR